VAGGDIIERWPTNGTKVAITQLLTNDSDADDDALTWVIRDRFLRAARDYQTQGTCLISRGRE
jgi:hypothetical protein